MTRKVRSIPFQRGADLGLTKRCTLQWRGVRPDAMRNPYRRSRMRLSRAEPCAMASPESRSTENQAGVNRLAL